LPDIVIFEIAVKLFKVPLSHRSSIKKPFEPSTVKIGGTVHKICRATLFTMGTVKVPSVDVTDTELFDLNVKSLFSRLIF
jgi:hypothetical protein